MTLLQTIYQGLELTLDGYRQLMFIKRFLKPLVSKHCKALDYHLNNTERKKVLFYYPVYTVLACAQMYVTLKGRPLTAIERKRLTLVGAMATLCDDLIDEEKWSRDSVLNLLSITTAPADLSKKAKLLLRLNSEFYALGPVSPDYLVRLKTALLWQAESAIQNNPNATLNEIVEVSRKKNGYTSLMFASLLDENWSPAEQAFIYQSAIVGQLTNDSFDVYFDTQNGIKTYFNTAQTVADTRNFFVQECKYLHTLVRECNATTRAKNKTVRRMSILHAFTLTALDMLQQAEDQSGGSPVDWKNVPRKNMVTDMALNKNRIKTIRYMQWLAQQ